MNSFWDFYNNDAAEKLGLRKKTFRKIFEYLDGIPGPITIVETGCARQANNWAGDGQSTVLFDKYIMERDEKSVCLTVDISQASVNACRSMVSRRTVVTQDDSVHYLSKLAERFQEEGKRINLLYLDSYDLDVDYWQPSAIHHLKELAASMRIVGEDTLVVVDDCPLAGNFIKSENNNISFLNSPKVGGKGRLVAEFASTCGAKLIFSDYQAGWVGY